ncbi:MAG TPA: hypothetical protein VEG25_00265 [Burkholderiales bacterium]|nr:hypothetical protein [Burkholderiales bacterium]
MAKEKNSSDPRKWWQWALMYPTLIIAIAGAIPTVYKLYQSYSYGVAFSEVDNAVAQNDLWAKNLSCLTGMTFEQIKTSSNVSVSVALCPSGDVLIRIKSPDPESKEIERWISLKQSLGTTGAASLFSAEALASPVLPKMVVAQTTQTVICQRQIGAGLLLMRVRKDNNQCVDETINTYTGVVVSSTPAPCDPKC